MKENSQEIKQENKLTKKEQVFCEYYCNFGCSGVDAIYQAGYKPKSRSTAYSMASENLRKPKILTRIQEIYKDFKFTNEEVMHEHWYLIKQHHDLSSKAKAIDMFYKKNGMYTPEIQKIVNKRPYEEYTDEELDKEIEKNMAKLYPDRLGK